MILFVLAGLFSFVCHAHTPASIPSTKTVVENVTEQDSILRAIDRDQEKLVKEWLAQGHSPVAIIKNKIQESLLDRAASVGAEKVFEVLLSSIESQGLILPRDGRGTPILLSMVTLAMPNQSQVKKYERMIEKFLVKHSDQINLKDKAYIGDGRTALHQAATNGNIVVLKALLSHGAQVNVVNSIGETPLHFAARFGKLETLKILITRGAKLNEKTKHTKATPLLVAAESGQEAIIRALLYAGAKKEEKDAFGKTAPERFKAYVTNYHQQKHTGN